MNLMAGKVRFYIQRLGGRPNPYKVRTPTALIAVRGTTFDVAVFDGETVEVRCLEGRVTVENTALVNREIREVILEPGRKTRVRPHEYPLAPVPNDTQWNSNRIIHVVKKDVPENNND